MNPLYLGLQGANLQSRYESAMTRTLALRHRLRKLKIIMRPDFAKMVYRRFAAGSPPRQVIESDQPSVPRALILAYHRVTRLKIDPQMLSVSPERFGEQLEVLKRRFEVIALRTLVKKLQEGRSVSGCVVITFDDGYADNLHVAKPLMERLDIPSTIFIATDHIGKMDGFWWDEIERIILGEHPLPRKLRLEIGGRHYRWDFEDDADFNSQMAEQFKSWYVGASETPTRRHQIYRELHRALHDLPSQYREETLEKLRTWAGLAREQTPSHCPLTIDELLELSRGKFIEIGAHTATHPALSMLPPVEQEAEIRGGKKRLEDMIGRSTQNFAYPYGSLTSYDSRTVDIVRTCGFQSACTTFADIIRPGCNLFQLPRLLVRDWDGDEFERNLRARISHWEQTT